MADAPSLHVTDMVCGYAERPLFAPVSFTLTAGQAMQVTGPNGQGKTTLLRTIVGLHRALSGAAEWRGSSELQEDLCFVGHENGLSSALTPLENLDLLLRLGGQAMPERKVRHTLTELGLGRLCHRPCGRLSAGQRRRVSLARLWLSEAWLWVLDEPAAALDVDARKVLCKHMAAFAEQGGMLLFTTHERLELPGIEPARLELQPC